MILLWQLSKLNMKRYVYFIKVEKKLLGIKRLIMKIGQRKVNFRVLSLWLSVDRAYQGNVNTLQSESAYTRTHTDDIISI